MKIDKKDLWFDARGLKEGELNLVDDAIQRGYKVILLDIENAGLKVTNRVKKAIAVKNVEELGKVPANSIAIVSNLNIVNNFSSKDIELAYFVNVIDKESMEKAANTTEPFKYLIVDFKDDTNIPLELILAKLQDKSVSVYKIINTAQEGIIAMGVMEIGSDGVILRTKDVREMTDLSQNLDKLQKKSINLSEAEIVEIKHLEMGQRACIDTTSMMDEGEGMIVGSTSEGGLLMCAEVYYLPYMNTRPFRVNAGAVHSYVWGPDNMAEYISDLRAGSKVLAVSTSGEIRTINVGRIKTEVRPLLLIIAKVGDVILNTIVQDDWHIRLYGAKKEVLHVTELKPGDKVLAYVCEPGRHVGIKINETILER